MRPFAILLASLILFSAGCSAPREEAPQQSRSVGSTAESLETAAPASQGQATQQKVSLTQVEAGQAAPATQRKIIRNASLTVEVAEPAEAQRRVASVAESSGGFVVTSESRQRGGDDDVRPYEVVTMEIRVPAERFDAVLQEVRRVGTGVVEERISGQDVTEEYIDLEARISTQRALEAQFLEIMKQSRQVSDALQVQRELANVRTEIERLEGRRRFLENQTSLSTIKVTLQPPRASVTASGFFHGVRRAFTNGFNVALAVALFLIQFVIVLIPIVVMLVLPVALIVRFLLRRFRGRPPATEKLQ